MLGTCNWAYIWLKRNHNKAARWSKGHSPNRKQLAKIFLKTPFPVLNTTYILLDQISPDRNPMGYGRSFSLTKQVFPWYFKRKTQSGKSQWRGWETYHAFKCKAATLDCFRERLNDRRRSYPVITRYYRVKSSVVRSLSDKPIVNLEPENRAFSYPPTISSNFFENSARISAHIAGLPAFSISRRPFVARRQRRVSVFWYFILQ